MDGTAKGRRRRVREGAVEGKLYVAIRSLTNLVVVAGTPPPHVACVARTDAGVSASLTERAELAASLRRDT